MIATLGRMGAEGVGTDRWRVLGMPNECVGLPGRRAIEQDERDDGADKYLLCTVLGRPDAVLVIGGWHHHTEQLFWTRIDQAPAHVDQGGLVGEDQKRNLTNQRACSTGEKTRNE